MVTFDAGGVSGHPNHGALAHAMMNLAAEGFQQRVWLLETTSLVRKYLGLVDVPLSFLLLPAAAKDDARVALNVRPWSAYSAMLAHASQFVWYRRLFILFSRYTYVNTLVLMHAGGAKGGGGAKAQPAASRRGKGKTTKRG